jgi:hypothetical protein
VSTKYLTSLLVFEALKGSVTQLVASNSDVDDAGDRIVPRDLRQWLARLRLLEGVPFCYLAADSLLLPPESIRFFYVDRNWTDALIQGALSVGTVNSSDRAQLEQLHRMIRDEIDEEERLVRRPDPHEVQKGPAGTITGLLLRSRAVSGWPAMHVRAYRKEVGKDDEIIPESHPDRLKVVRMERLAPAVLLVLFDGVPAVIHVEEPRQGVQFGVRLVRIGETANFRAEVIARDALTSQDVVPERMVQVFFRPGAPGVIDMRRTASELMGTPGTNMGEALDGAEFALEMIRFPYRQVFGDPSQGSSGNILDVFRPSLSMAQLKAKFLEAIE